MRDFRFVFWLWTEWTADWLAVILAIKLYGIGQPNKVFATIKTTLIFPSFLLALVSFVFVSVFLPLASAKQFILALKHFLALTHKFVWLFSFVPSFFRCAFVSNISGWSVFVERFFLFWPKRSNFDVISRFGCVKWPIRQSKWPCDTPVNGRTKVAVTFVSLAI